MYSHCSTTVGREWATTSSFRPYLEVVHEAPYLSDYRPYLEVVHEAPYLSDYQ